MDVYKGKVTIKELMDMPNQDFYALYHSAWKISVEKQKEAARLEEEERKEERSRQNNNNSRPLSSRERLAALRNIDTSELSEMMEDL